jgi:hypothetical protein
VGGGSYRPPDGAPPPDTEPDPDLDDSACANADPSGFSCAFDASFGYSDKNYQPPAYVPPPAGDPPVDGDEGDIDFVPPAEIEKNYDFVENCKRYDDSGTYALWYWSGAVSGYPMVIKWGGAQVVNVRYTYDNIYRDASGHIYKVHSRTSSGAEAPVRYEVSSSNASQTTCRVPGTSYPEDAEDALQAAENCQTYLRANTYAFAAVGGSTMTIVWAGMRVYSGPFTQGGVWGIDGHIYQLGVAVGDGGSGGADPDTPIESPDPDAPIESPDYDAPISYAAAAGTWSVKSIDGAQVACRTP